MEEEEDEVCFLGAKRKESVYGIESDIWAALPKDIQNEITAENERKSLHQTHHTSIPKVLGLKQARLSLGSFRGSNETTCAPNPTDNFFTDAIFPPDASSIDGIKKAPTTANTENFSQLPDQSAPLCGCKKIAAIKCVQGNTCNRGRFYAACPSSTRAAPCSFFAWLDDASAGRFLDHDSHARSKTWQHFGFAQGFRFVDSSGYKAADVLQGSVGDCWFLSAICVVVERPELMFRICGDPALQLVGGKCAFELFLEGGWKRVEVDDNLPCFGTDSTELSAAARSKQKSASPFTLAYCKSNRGLVWAPFLEKSYAKAHGSYQAISGGEISEAMLDLTGCPVETISIEKLFGENDDELWLRLVSYSDNSFPIGASTSVGGEGIVGGHAYSVVGILSVSCVEVGVGWQKSMNEFVGGGKSGPTTTDECVPSDFVRQLHLSSLLTRDGQLRLVRVRNPWGKGVEWSGAFSKKSNLWSKRLVEAVGDKGVDSDGCFWMPFTDFARIFARIDVCKAYRGWYTQCLQGWTRAGTVTAGSGSFILTITQPTSMILTAIQRTKRGKSGLGVHQRDRRYMYTDLSVFLISGLNLNRNQPANVIASSFNGRRRDTSPIEMQLDAGVYRVVVAHSIGGSTAPSDVTQPFVLHIFSSRAVCCEGKPMHSPSPLDIGEWVILSTLRLALMSHTAPLGLRVGAVITVPLAEQTASRTATGCSSSSVIDLTDAPSPSPSVPTLTLTVVRGAQGQGIVYLLAASSISTTLTLTLHCRNYDVLMDKVVKKGDYTEGVAGFDATAGKCRVIGLLCRNYSQRQSASTGPPQAGAGYGVMNRPVELLEGVCVGLGVSEASISRGTGVGGSVLFGAFKL